MTHEYNFLVDESIKQEYLSIKPELTAKNDYYVLKIMDKFEDLIGKSVYDMSVGELKELIFTFDNSSTQAVEKNVSIMRKYIDFCISKRIVQHMENRLAFFTSSDADQFVHQNVLQNRYITREQLKEYQRILYNEQDQLLLELLFVGVYGNRLEEIINLRIDDIDEENKIIKRRRDNNEISLLQVETHTIELIKAAYNQEFYVENNGDLTNNFAFSSTPREVVINKVENYVLRVPGKTKYKPFDYGFLTSRFTRIKKFVGNIHITPNTIYRSGMFDKALKILQEKGVVSKEDYAKICVEYNFGKNPEGKWWHLRDLFEQFLEARQV